jgi:hypothetical protein
MDTGRAIAEASPPSPVKEPDQNAKRANISKAPQTTLYRLGYWLPCGQANFHRPGSATSASQEPDADEGSGSYHIDVIRGVGNANPPKLSAALYSRLAYVLTRRPGPGKPMHLAKRDDRGRISAAVFPLDVAANANNKACAILHSVGISRALIYADELGFVTIVAEVINPVRGSITENIAAAFGMIFATTPNEQDASQHLYREDRDYLDKLISRYARGDTGLNFFQLNTILEGLWNSALVPEIFFEQRDLLSSEGLNSRSGHSARPGQPSGQDSAGPPPRNLTGFFNSIVTTLSSQKEAAALDRFNAIYDTDKAQNDSGELLGQLDELLGNNDRALIMDHFLEATLKDVLLYLKWSVERTRRAFLDKTLGVLHRHSLLYQIEDTDSSALALASVNEVQLRGYLMLVSAKLPLVMNVARYVEDVLTTFSDDDAPTARNGHGPARNGQVGKVEAASHAQLTQLVNTWKALLDAIKENVQSLEKAVEASWRDRLLYEEEQARAEQEALAEIERNKSRTISGGSEDSLAVRLTLPVTVSAVVFAVWSTTYGSGSHHDWTKGALIAVSSLVVSYIAVAAYYTIRNKLRPPLQHNYELNFRLDRPVEGSRRRALLLSTDNEFGSGHNDPEGNDADRWWRCDLTDEYTLEGSPGKPFGSRPSRERWPGCVGIEKIGPGSFRIERVDDAECVLKVHSDARILWRRLDSTKYPWQRLICRIAPMRTSLDVIAEILVHRPSAGDEVLLREVRAIAIGRRRLTPRDMWEMTTAITSRFINPYLSDDDQVRTCYEAEPPGALTAGHRPAIDASVRLIAPRRPAPEAGDGQPAPSHGN